MRYNSGNNPLNSSVNKGVNPGIIFFTFFHCDLGRFSTFSPFSFTIQYLKCRKNNCVSIHGQDPSEAAFEDRLRHSGLSFRRLLQMRQMCPFIPKKQRIQQVGISWPNLSQNSLCLRHLTPGSVKGRGGDVRERPHLYQLTPTGKSAEVTRR